MSVDLNELTQEEAEIARNAVSEHRRYKEAMEFARFISSAAEKAPRLHSWGGGMMTSCTRCGCTFNGWERIDPCPGPR